MKRDTPVHLTLLASFQTDGDFTFDRKETIIDTSSTLYKPARVNLSAFSEDGTETFRLSADGPSDSCRYAARDLLQNLICALRTSRHYLVEDIYKFLSGPLDAAVWNDADEGVHYHDAMYGNYEGTLLTLDISPAQPAPDTGATPCRTALTLEELLQAAAAAASLQETSGVPAGPTEIAVLTRDGTVRATNAAYDPRTGALVISAGQHDDAPSPYEFDPERPASLSGIPDGYDINKEDNR